MQFYTAPTMNEFAATVEMLRPQLLRFARVQLRNDAWAEDAVSETLLAALEKPQAFAGRSQLKTWLVGILKHKVIDQMRRHSRECSWSPADDDTGDEVENTLFDARGVWQELPAEWGNPESALRQSQFLAVLEACVEVLPPQQGRVFLMREWLELPSETICNEVGISATNLWVILHRARLRLRECLQTRWFSNASQPAR